jgi:uncharacterized RDD family membrane protein YckC
VPVPAQPNLAAEAPRAADAPPGAEAPPAADAPPGTEAPPAAAPSGADAAAPVQAAQDAPPVQATTPGAAPDAGAPSVGPDPALAQWWRRLLAFVIDSLILTLATGALWGRLLASFANRMSNAMDARAARAPGSHGAIGRVFSNTTGPYLIVLVATIVVAITYYWLLTGYWGTTIGKRALGTWVVTAGDRTRVSLPASFLRALIFVLGGEVVPLFFLVDNLWLIWDPRRQALHDQAARTLVVRKPPQMN